MLRTLQPPSKPDLHRDSSLTSQLSSESFLFKSQLTSPYLLSTPYKYQLNPNRYNYLYIPNASKQLAPADYCNIINQKIFTLQMKFLRPSVFDLHTGD